MSDRKAAALIRGMQKREDAVLARRKARVMQMLKRYGPALLDFEVRALEAAIAPAVGRIVMESK